MGLIKKLIIVFIVLSLLASFMIVKSQNTDFQDTGSVLDFGKAYVSWVGNVVKNVAGLTAHVIMLDWLPETA